MPGVPQGSCIPFGKSSLHLTSPWCSLSSVISPAGPQQPQDPGLCWSCAVTLSQDPGCQVSLGVLSGAVTAKHLQTQPCSSTWVLLGLCRAGQLWDVGSVGQHLEDLVDDPAEEVSAHCRGWTRWPLKISSNPNYSMKAWNISLLNSGIKPTLWIQPLEYLFCSIHSKGKCLPGIFSQPSAACYLLLS